MANASPTSNKLTNALTRYREANPVTSIPAYSSNAPATSPKEASVAQAASQKASTLEWDTVPFKENMLVDGDSLLIDGNSTRYASEQGNSVDTFESWDKGINTNTPSGRAKFFKQQLAASAVLDKDRKDVTREDIIGLGQKGKDANLVNIMEGQNPENASLEYAVTGKGTYGRNLIKARNPVTGKDLVDAQNTPELNASYDSRYNGVQRLKEIAQARALASDDNAYMSDEFSKTNVGKALNTLGAYGAGAGSLIDAIAEAPGEALRGLGKLYETLGYNPALSVLANATANSGGLELAEKAGERIDKEASKLFHQGETKKIQEAFGKDFDSNEGVVDVASAMFETAIDNPAAAVQTFANSFPQMQALAKGGVKALPAYTALVLDGAAEAKEEFKKINGREMNHAEYAKALATHAVSVGTDVIESKFLLNKLPGSGKLAKAIGKATNSKVANIAGKVAKVPGINTAVKATASTATEAVQEGFQTAAEEYAVGQDLSKLTDKETRKKIAVGSAMGAHSGGIAGSVGPALNDSGAVIKESLKKIAKGSKAVSDIAKEASSDTSIKRSTNPTEFSNPSEQIRAYSNEHNKPDIEATPKEKAAHKAKVTAVLNEGIAKEAALDKEITAMPKGTQAEKKAVGDKIEEHTDVVLENNKATEAYDAYITQTRETPSEFDTTVTTATNSDTQTEPETVEAREKVIESLDRLSPEQVTAFRVNATPSEIGVIDAVKVAQGAATNLDNVYEIAKTENIPINTELKGTLNQASKDFNRAIITDNKTQADTVAAELITKIKSLQQEAIGMDETAPDYSVKLEELKLAEATYAELGARYTNAFPTEVAPAQEAEVKPIEQAQESVPEVVKAVAPIVDTAKVASPEIQQETPTVAKEVTEAKTVEPKPNTAEEATKFDKETGVTLKQIESFPDGRLASTDTKSKTITVKAGITKQEVVDYLASDSPTGKQKKVVDQHMQDSYGVTVDSFLEKATDKQAQEFLYEHEAQHIQQSLNEDTSTKLKEYFTGTDKSIAAKYVPDTSSKFLSNNAIELETDANITAIRKVLGDPSIGESTPYSLGESVTKGATVTVAKFAANRVANGATISTDKEGNIVSTKEGKTEVLGKGHILADWFKASPVSDNVKSPNVLQTIPNFFSDIRGNLTKTELISNPKEMSPERRKGLTSLSKYHADFVRIFKEVLYQPPIVPEILNDNLDMVHYLGKYDIKEGTNSYNNVTTYNSKGQKGTAPGIVFDDNILSSIAVASYNFLATQGKATLAADPARVQNILGIGENDTVSQALEDLLGDKGLSISGVVESMGTEVYKYTGLAIKNKDVSVDIKQKMIMSLGTYALMTLMEAGHINTNVVKNSDIIALHPDSPLDADKTSNFVQLNHTTDENGKKIPVAELETLIDTNKASEGLLKDLFNTTSYKTGPTFEKPTDQKEIRTKRGIKNAPDAVKEVINKVSSTPNKVKKSQLYSFLALSDEGKRAANGYETDVDSLHITDRKKAIAVNAIIDRTLEDITEFVGEIHSQDKGMDSEFFYPQELWQSFRQGNAANSMNPVSNKIVRHLLGTANHVVQVETDTARNHFKLAVMEGFGYKVGSKQEKSVEDFDNLLKPGSNVANAQEYQDAIAVIKNNLETQEEYSPEDEAILLKAIDLGGEKTWTLDVLVALATYEADKPFETNIFREVDGITNGTAIQLLMLAGAKDWDAARELLDATGLFSGKYTSYSDWFADVGNFDVYQMSALSFAATLDAFKGSDNSKDVNPEYDRDLNQKAFSKVGGNAQTIVAIDSFTKNLYENDTLTKAARDLFKAPTMQSNYGAGISSLMQIMNEELIKNIYGELMESVTDIDGVASVDTAAITALEKRLTDLVGSAVKIDKDSPRDWELTPAQIFNINKKNKAYQGKALEAALRNRLGVMMDRGGELNNAMTVTNVIFKMKYEAAVEAKQKQNQEERGHPVLSENDKTEILATLTKVMPAFKTFFSNKEDLSDEMMLAKEKKQKNYDPGRQTQVQSKSVLKGMGDTASQRSLVSHPSEIGFGDTGAGSTVGGIQSTDSTIMNLLQADFDILNVWDASGFSITDAEEGSTRFNEHFFNVLKNFSLGKAFQNTLERAVAELSPEERKTVDAYFQAEHKDNQLGHTFTDFDREGAPRKYANLKHFVAEYADKTDAAENTRHEWLDKLQNVNQYNGGFNTGFKPAAKANKESIYPDIATENAELQKQADALTKDIFGSQDSQSNPFEFEPETSQSLNKSNVEKTFEELGKLGEDIDSPAHIAALRGVLGNLITKTITPLKVTLETSTKDPVTYGEFEKDTIRLNTATAPALDSSPMSTQEALVHELVHAVTAQGLNDPKNFLIKQRLAKIQKLAQREVTPNSLLTVPVDQASDLQKENAQARWEHIFESENSLAEFVAFGKTNNKFMQLLEGISNKRAGNSFKGLTLLQGLNEAFQQLMDAVTTFIIGANKTSDIQKEVEALTNRIAGITGRKETLLAINFPKLDNLTEVIQERLSEWVLAPVSEWSSASRREGVLGKVKDRIESLALIATESKLRDTLFSAMDKVALRMGMTEQGIVKSLIQEIRGMKGNIETKYARVLSQSNKVIDQLRKDVANTQKNYILTSFKTLVSIEEQKALFLYGKSDFEILANSYDIKDQLAMHEKNSSKLQEEIANTIEELGEFGNKPQAYFKDQALNLAHIMINDSAIYTGGMANAYNIARVVSLEGTVPITWDVGKAEVVIDKLASLYALQIMPDSTKKILADVTKREYAADPKTNGVSTIIENLTHLKNTALAEGFEGQKGIMRKGYMADLLNQDIATVKAPLSKSEELVAQGYTFDKTRPLKKDPNDSSKGTQYLFTIRGGSKDAWVKQAVSLTSENAQGSDLIRIFNQQGSKTPLGEAFREGYRMNKRNRRDAEKHFNQGIKTDYSNENNVNLAEAVVSEEGAIVGYRYRMNSATRDQLLERDTTISTVLGTMAANITDKVNTKKINDDVVNVTIEDYKDNYTGNEHNFVELSADSDIKAYREIYKLLPKSMKHTIKEVWGEDKIIMRRNMVREVFGYRKVSAAKFVSDLDLVNSKWINTISNGERDWQEVMRGVKDAIVIKSGVVGANNLISNMSQVLLEGVNPAKAVKLATIGTDALTQYMKDKTELDTLELDLKVRMSMETGERATKKRRAAKLTKDISTNPITPLIDDGQFQTIIEDVNVGHEIEEATRDTLQERILNTAKKVLPEGAIPKEGDQENLLITVGKTAMMTHSTPIYKGLRNVVMYGDIVARYTIYQDMIDKGHQSKNVLDYTRDLFVNYDLSSHPYIKYLNDVGILWFTMYTLRMLPMYVRNFTAFPARVLGLSAIETVTGDIQSVVHNDINLLNKFKNPIDMAIESSEIHLLNLSI